jgi:hypothetical protein
VTKEIPEHLDWIAARAKCSIEQVFESLRGQVKKDVEARNLLPDHSRFNVHFSGDTFTVMRGDGGGLKSVVFALPGKYIEIQNGDRQVLFTASLTLNDAGECKLKVDERELELWQVRRRALEELFFGPFG